MFGRQNRSRQDLSQSRRSQARGRRRLGVQSLEDRCVMDVTLTNLAAVNLLQGKDQYIPLQAVDSNNANASFTYTVTDNNASVTTTVLPGSATSRSVRFHVEQTAGPTPFSGDLEFRLFEDLSPLATARLINLINTNFYTSNSITFHRVINNFIAQWGDPTGTGSGGSPLPDFGDEYQSNTTFVSRGLLAMANSGDDTNDSQMFVVDTDISLSSSTTLPQHLNFNHTIFGILTSGQDILDKIMTAQNPGNPTNKPTNNIVITSAQVFTDTKNAVLKISAPAGVTGSVQFDVTANNGGAGATDSQTKSQTITVAADTNNDRAFIGQINGQPVNNVTTVTTNEDNSVTITMTGVDLESDTLNFVVRSATNFVNQPSNVTSAITVTPASGSTPATATIVLTPAANFNGSIDLRLGVRDQTARATNSSGTLLPLDDQGNFDTQLITLVINPVNDRPTATSQTLNTALNTAVNVTLAGDDGDSNATQTLTWNTPVLVNPALGVISNFDAQAGTFTFTPNTGVSGQQKITITVSDNGGTANSGVDTSNPATITININAPPAPTGLDLAAASDNGLYNDDNFTSVEQLTITVSAADDATVKLFANGSSTGIAMTKIGTPVSGISTFSVTLPAGTLKVGENSFTAQASRGGADSPQSTALEVIFAPSLGGVYRVPGDVGEAATVNAGLIKRLARLRSEVGYFKVDDATGKIGTATPGSQAWLNAAFNSSSKVVLHAPAANAGATDEITVEGGDFIVFYIVVDGTSASFLADNLQNDRNGPHAFFSLAAANPDKQRHVNMVGDPTTGDAVLGFEDLWGGGDRDFNDVVLALSTSINPGAEIAEYLRTPAGQGKAVKLRATLSPTGRENGDGPGAAGGEFGVFEVEDELGRVNGLFPGNAGYLAAALAAANKHTLFLGGASVGSSTTVNLDGGTLLGFYYIPGGTSAGVLATNANNETTKSPILFMSFDSGNPDDDEHFRWFGAETVESIGNNNNGDGSVQDLHIMGTLNGTDANFDQFKLSLSFST